jgi:hypothetical protein
MSDDRSLIADATRYRQLLDRCREDPEACPLCGYDGHGPFTTAEIDAEIDRRHPPEEYRAAK